MNPLLEEELVPKDELYEKKDRALVDSTSVPHHVAIIMDGNRRWAKQHGFPYMAGHWKGADTLTKIVKAASELGVRVLTVYSFSTENWNRLPEEVEALMDLVQVRLLQQQESMIHDGVKKALVDVKNATRHGNKIDLVLALNYGGRDDIRRAIKTIAEDCVSGKLLPEALSEQVIATYLDTAAWGDPQLVIRTSGELRISNFLLWQISYSEVYVTDVLWPDFNEKNLLSAIIEYQRRHRRHGG
ncbi:MAG: polyprenyl diphosphate synthase [Chlamydiota bacterium]